MITSNTKNNKILVVEDSATTRLILKQGLSNAGYQINLAENGYQALLAFEENHFDLILMDVNMPVMDGFECCIALRKTTQGKNIPIILLTGRDDHESINHAFEVGASDFITKPINLRLLAQRIRYALRDADRELALLNAHAQQQQLIDQLQSTQTQLIQSEKLASIGLLAAGIAHEINTPLATIKANITYLGDDTEQLIRLANRLSEGQSIEATEKQFLTELIDEFPIVRHDTLESISKIQHIIQSLMSLSQQPNENSICNPVSVIQESVEVCLNALGFSGVLHSDYQCMNVSVKIKRADLLHVINSIILNALEAAGIDSTLKISCCVDHDYCIIELIDEGPGIPEHHLSHIFEPFFTTKPPGKGTGLSLSLAYQILKKANGEIKVSNLKNKGVCVTLKLPLVNDSHADLVN